MEIFKIKIFKIVLVLKHNIKNIIYIKNAIKLLMSFSLFYIVLMER